jgi:hypothetical protein
MRGMDGDSRIARAIAKCSPDTALRDIKDLLERGCAAKKAQAGGCLLFMDLPLLFGFGLRCYWADRLNKSG